MRRQLIALALAAAGGAARAQPAPDPAAPGSAAPDDAAPDARLPAPAAPGRAAPPVATAAPSDDDMGDQAISAELGVAAGGRVTPGGLRIAGQYLYQLSDDDWFDGAASFTYGSGSAACFRNRNNAVVCQHGLADGAGLELQATIRHMLAPQGAFHPFVRLGVGLGVVRFGRDDVTGFTIPAHGGGGVRVTIAPGVALVAEGDLALGFGSFTRGLGSQPQLGLAISAGAEFRLR
jgi:opacity protein-like surface antigen